MKYILNIARFIVGNLFIFSGAIKGNDPLGFSYKLEEYFLEFGMNWHWLLDNLVPLAAFICILEIVLGVAVLVGYRMKPISWILLLMIVFFTFLTGASAIFEIVRSCGCFGDAIPLTPWQSFYKDLILLGLILLIFWKRKVIKPWRKPLNYYLIIIFSAIVLGILSYILGWAMGNGAIAIVALSIIFIHSTKHKERAASTAVILSIIYGLFLTIMAVTYLPFKDFRAYAVGKNIPEGMTIPPDAKQPIYENTLVYKNVKTGEEKELIGDAYNQSKIWEDKDWEWKETTNKLIEEGFTPAISDFSILGHDEIDYTDIILSENQVLLIIDYNLQISNTNHWKEVSKLAKEAEMNGIKVIGLSAAGKTETDNYINKYNLPFDYYVSDGIVLKTIVRANPGLVMLKKGTVTGKWSYNDLPEVSEL